MVLKPIVIFSFVILQLIYFCASESPPSVIFDGMKIADPKNDFVFKKIFSDHAVLLAFINSVVSPKIPFQSVQLLREEHPLHSPNERTVILDIICTTGENDIIVEVQVRKEIYFVERSLYYATRRYTSQLGKAETPVDEQQPADEQSQTGKTSQLHEESNTMVKPPGKTKNDCEYRKLKPVHFIAICDFELFPDKKEYISHHLILDNNTHENDLKGLTFTFIELEKLRKKKLFDPNSYKSDLDMFCFFFLFEGRNLQYMEGLKTIYKKNPLIKKAVEIANSATWSVQEYNEYLEKMIANEKAMGERDAAIQEGHEIGKKDGKIEGRIEGKIEGKIETENNVILAMISHNPKMTPPELAIFSGIPEDRIKKYLSTSKTNELQNS